MATDTRQLNVRIPISLYEELETAVAAAPPPDKGHAYSKNDAVRDALRGWLDADDSDHPESELEAVCGRLERVADDLDRLRSLVNGK